MKESNAATLTSCTRFVEKLKISNFAAVSSAVNQVSVSATKSALESNTNSLKTADFDLMERTLIKARFSGEIDAKLGVWE